jgi:hypothetical protein
VCFSFHLDIIHEITLSDLKICTDHIFHITVFSFPFISGVSRTSLDNSVILIAYNVFYTSVPVLDSVLGEDLSEETRPHHP